MKTSRAPRPDLSERNMSHGLSKTKAYKVWKDMRARCGDPKNRSYPRYGGRGIRVCSEWQDFAKFFADMGDRPEGLTLDRIDCDGEYSASNCRWADIIKQANNRSNNHVIEHDGQSRTLQEWCKIFKIEPSKVRYRLKQGWPFQNAFADKDYRK